MRCRKHATNKQRRLAWYSKEPPESHQNLEADTRTGMNLNTIQGKRRHGNRSDIFSDCCCTHMCRCQLILVPETDCRNKIWAGMLNWNRWAANGSHMSPYLENISTVSLPLCSFYLKSYCVPMALLHSLMEEMNWKRTWIVLLRTYFISKKCNTSSFKVIYFKMKCYLLPLYVLLNVAGNPWYFYMFVLLLV